MRTSRTRIILVVLLLLALGASASAVGGAAAYSARVDSYGAVSGPDFYQGTSTLQLSGSYNGAVPQDAKTGTGSGEPSGSGSTKLIPSRNVLGGQIDGTTKWLMAMMSVSLLVVGIGFAVQRSARRLDRE